MSAPTNGSPSIAPRIFTSPRVPKSSAASGSTTHVHAPGLSPFWSWASNSLTMTAACSHGGAGAAGDQGGHLGERGEVKGPGVASRISRRPAGFCEGRQVDSAEIAERSAAATLLGLASLHVPWAAGSPWPARDRDALADLMAGRAGGPVPAPAACLAVATPARDVRFA